MKNDIEYKELMISLFSDLVDIFDFEIAILLFYQINKKHRGLKI